MRSAKLVLSALPLLISAVALAEPGEPAAPAPAAPAPAVSPFLVPPPGPALPQRVHPADEIVPEAAPVEEVAPVRARTPARISVSRSPHASADAARARAAAAAPLAKAAARSSAAAASKPASFRDQRNIAGQIRAITGPGGMALSGVKNPGKNAPPMITRDSLRDIPSTRSASGQQPSMRDSALHNAIADADDAERTFRADARDHSPAASSMTRDRAGGFLPGQGSQPGAQRSIVPELSSQVAASAVGKSSRSAALASKAARR